MTPSQRSSAFALLEALPAIVLAAAMAWSAVLAVNGSRASLALLVFTAWLRLERAASR